jgi:hypothetical protein
MGASVRAARLLAALAMMFDVLVKLAHQRNSLGSGGGWMTGTAGLFGWGQRRPDR